MSYLLELFIKYYARDPWVRFNSVKADNEKHVVDRRLDPLDTRIDDALPGNQNHGCALDFESREDQRDGQQPAKNNGKSAPLFRDLCR